MVDNSMEVEFQKEYSQSLLGVLSRKLDELGISTRLANGLEFDNIVYVGDLVQKTERDMLRIPNFGNNSLLEAKELLSVMNLHLGMDIPDWPLDDY